MGKRLAINGHSTRGKEVIKLLKVLGGINKFQYNGSQGFSYFIEGKCITFCGKETLKNNGNYIIYELEEFLEKYPFYNGDKVFDIADGDPGIITVMKWDEDVSDMKYHVAFDNGDMGWYTNDTIDFYLNKNNKKMNEIQKKRDTDKIMFMLGHTLVPNKVDDKLEYKIIDGYEFDKVENGKIILKPIKPKYPTTYEECCEVLGIGNYFEPEIRNATTEECHIFMKLIRIKRCRNAYWKIAGEQMGLDKPWEPDWTNEKQPQYGLYEQMKNTSINPATFVFPTEEMRDAFYENFKDLIEQCKELL